MGTAERTDLDISDGLRDLSDGSQNQRRPVEAVDISSEQVVVRASGICAG